MKVRFFRDAAAFRRWLEWHHARVVELWIGFHRKAAGESGLTYREALDQALCFGWIDGVRRRVDADRYASRFTPRRPRSVWSRVNIRRVEELRQLGLVAPPGQAAFDARDSQRSGIYSFERRPGAFPPGYVKRFRQYPAAWEFFQKQPPGYRRTVVWWVISAAKEETRGRRLAALIDRAAHGQRLDMLAPYRKPRR